MNNDRIIANMLLECAKNNENSNNEIKYIEYVYNTQSINYYCNEYNKNDSSYIVTVYADCIDTREKTNFTAELFFSVENETIYRANHMTDSVNVTYLYAINQH